MLKTLLPRLYYSTFFNKSSIGQLYIVSEDIDTYFCFNNHKGFLFPQADEQLTIKLDVHSSSGKKILSKNFNLNAHDSLSVSIRDLLKEKLTIGKEEILGSIVCTTPKTTLQNHFYTYYRDDKTESVAMIHPQSTVGRKTTDRSWISNQIIHTKDLENITLYQMNHSRGTSSCHYYLRSVADGSIFAEADVSVKQLGVTKVKFDLTDSPAQLCLSLDNLLSPNGKPLIMRRYKNNKFTINHG